MSGELSIGLLCKKEDRCPVRGIVMTEALRGEVLQDIVPPDAL